MMEIFVGYTKFSPFHDLEKTMEAWDEIEEAEPIAVECSLKKFETFRRMTAEFISTGDYIISDIGYIPTYPDIIKYAERLLKDHPKVGMFTMKSCIHICRKGVIDKWPEKKSQYYLREHARAYLRKGYEVEPCPQIYCRRISVS